MTIYEAILIAKQLLGITDNSEDVLLSVLGDIALADAIALTQNPNMLEQSSLLGRMIQFLYNSRNNETLASQSLATVSESYVGGASAYSTQILTALKGYAKLKTL